MRRIILRKVCDTIFSAGFPWRWTIEAESNWVVRLFNKSVTVYGNFILNLTQCGIGNNNFYQNGVELHSRFVISFQVTPSTCLSAGFRLNQQLYLCPYELILRLRVVSGLPSVGKAEHDVAESTALYYYKITIYCCILARLWESASRFFICLWRHEDGFNPEERLYSIGLVCFKRNIKHSCFTMMKCALWEPTPECSTDPSYTLFSQMQTHIL
jgi:hypothetical protein